MSGKFIVKKEYKETPDPHECNPPICNRPKGWGDEFEFGAGTIWECDCGQQWMVKGDTWKAKWVPPLFTKKFIFRRNIGR